ncbi:FMN-linked oxidoreductase [Violaceomyces palustris]|uniref:FMN-linked oxidoreductase n=1 Tax=Violaceomyces palustris TaxID=1673888 RepID=A0ACD0NU45_9BASI|nr:FMN-linked oxidoreductase [Violaceomyces palustris]
MPPSPLPLPCLRLVEAPMVNQSDLAFRLLAVENGATSTWTQMYHTDAILNDRDALETLLKSLEVGRTASENLCKLSPAPLLIPRKVGGEESEEGNGPMRSSAASFCPQIVQLAGNDPESLVKAARKVEHLADGIDLNLGCPQNHAKMGHYGAYLLPKPDWPLVETLVSSLSRSVQLPISTKIRLTPTHADQTSILAKRLSLAGSDCVILHARFASTSRRRNGPADLGQVKRVVQTLRDEGLLRTEENDGDGVRRTAVITNGNVRGWSDVVKNLEYTGANGVMVGEPLLEDPSLFHPSLGKLSSPPSKAELSRRYLELCERYPGTGSDLFVARQHVRNMLCPRSFSFVQESEGKAAEARSRADLYQRRSVVEARVKSAQSVEDLREAIRLFEGQEEKVVM